ncbi:hypothetical protein AB0O32_15705 [Streptomyces rubiginosohelvolus]|uniref:hypothetical protein n=1 Tax=Streptomyces rubiginosohelvolus TaxID=67362 RepID=UPI003424758F
MLAPIGEAAHLRLLAGFNFSFCMSISCPENDYAAARQGDIVPLISRKGVSVQRVIRSALALTVPIFAIISLSACDSPSGDEKSPENVFKERQANRFAETASRVEGAASELIVKRGELRQCIMSLTPMELCSRRGWEKQLREAAANYPDKFGDDARRSAVEEYTASLPECQKGAGVGFCDANLKGYVKPLDKIIEVVQKDLGELKDIMDEKEEEARKANVKWYDVKHLGVTPREVVEAIVAILGAR